MRNNAPVFMPFSPRWMNFDSMERVDCVSDLIGRYPRVAAPADALPPPLLPSLPFHLFLFFFFFPFFLPLRAFLLSLRAIHIRVRV